MTTMIGLLSQLETYLVQRMQCYEKVGDDDRWELAHNLLCDIREILDLDTITIVLRFEEHGEAWDILVNGEPVSEPIYRRETARSQARTMRRALESLGYTVRIKGY